MKWLKLNDDDNIIYSDSVRVYNEARVFMSLGWTLQLGSKRGIYSDNKHARLQRDKLVVYII